MAKNCNQECEKAKVKWRRFCARGNYQDLLSLADGTVRRNEEAMKWIMDTVV